MLLQNAPYPQDRRVHHEATSLVKAGYQVTVICPRARGQRELEIHDGVLLKRFRKPDVPPSNLGYIVEYTVSIAAIFWESLWIFLNRDFDIIHAHHPPDMLAIIGAFYKLFGKKYVLDHHDLSPELYASRSQNSSRGLMYQLLKSFERFAFRIADQVIATNESYKQVEMGRGGVPEEDITVVRNGPILNEFQLDTAKSDKSEPEKLIIGYLGVIGVQDGTENLLHALHHLKRDLGREDFKALIVGSGDALAGLRILAKELQIDDLVEFTGWVNDRRQVARYLNSMDICVAPEPSNPYNDRSTMVKILEYMAMGKPIVAFDLPEHNASAKDSAIYAHGNDVYDLATKISALMDDPERREQMGNLGKRRIISDLGWQFQEKNLLRVYDRWMGRNQEGGQ